MKSYKTQAPEVKLVLRHPWLLFSTFFGSGCITPAPGTWGSLAAWLAFCLLELALPRDFMWVLCVAIFILGIVSVERSAPLLGKTDHGSIVIDEVAAVWLVLLLTPLGFFWQFFSVLAFRFFDIVKLPPASAIDAGRQSGFTVMLDDIFAAVYAIVLVNTAAWAADELKLSASFWDFF